MRRTLLATVVALVACAARPAPVERPVALPRAPAPAPPLRPELVAFPSGALTLHGFLWRPAGAGPFPAIVFNHGSEKLPGAKPDQAAFFVPHGFVLFVPHRRGQGRSGDAAPYIRDLGSPRAVVDALGGAQTDDVMAAVAYLGTLPYVDRARVAVSGCSFGGIESLYAAARGTGIVAAIDFAGGAMSWAQSPLLQERMEAAARRTKVPVLFLQAENDFDTAPSSVLSRIVAAEHKPVRVHVYPPNGTTHEEGHHFCAGGANPPWADEVLAFLGDAMPSR